MSTLSVVMLLLASSASAAPTSPSPLSFRFAKAVSDGIVLQSAPKQAMVWGFCDAKAQVVVGFNGANIAATVGPDQVKQIL